MPTPFCPTDSSGTVTVLVSSGNIIVIAVTVGIVLGFLLLIAVVTLEACLGICLCAHIFRGKQEDTHFGKLNVRWLLQVYTLP